MKKNNIYAIYHHYRLDHLKDRYHFIRSNLPLDKTKEIIIAIDTRHWALLYDTRIDIGPEDLANIMGEYFEIEYLGTFDVRRKGFQDYMWPNIEPIFVKNNADNHSDTNLLQYFEDHAIDKYALCEYGEFASKAEELAEKWLPETKLSNYDFLKKLLNIHQTNHGDKNKEYVHTINKKMLEMKLQDAKD